MCGSATFEVIETSGQNSVASSPVSIKNSLAFILDDAALPLAHQAVSVGVDEANEPTAFKHKRLCVSTTISPQGVIGDTNEARDASRTSPPLPRKSSKYCIVEGCISRAKHARRCWKHGGSVKCKVAGCRNRAKTKGVCWSHGGGTICSVSQCTTIAVSNGVCWAHGGGKRCVTPGCSRPAYERTRNMCSMHYNAIAYPASPAPKREI